MKVEIQELHVPHFETYDRNIRPQRNLLIIKVCLLGSVGWHHLANLADTWLNIVISGHEIVKKKNPKAIGET